MSIEEVKVDPPDLEIKKELEDTEEPFRTLGLDFEDKSEDEGRDDSIQGDSVKDER
jgi:hypothetical protein